MPTQSVTTKQKKIVVGVDQATNRTAAVYTVGVRTER
jgi:hypothetical protein